MALCRVLGTKREEVTGGWRKLLNEHHTNLYCTGNDVRVMKSKMRRRSCSSYIRSDGTTYVYTNLWRTERGAADGKGRTYKRGHFRSDGL
jgi:hypothetical protein